MSEFVIFPEMIIAGAEELAECRDTGLSDEQTAVAVFLAMQGLLQIKAMRGESESVH